MTGYLPLDKLTRFKLKMFRKSNMCNTQNPWSDVHIFLIGDTIKPNNLTQDSKKTKHAKNIDYPYYGIYPENSTPYNLKILMQKG